MVFVENLVGEASLGCGKLTARSVHEPYHVVVGTERGRLPLLLATRSACFDTSFSSAFATSSSFVPGGEAHHHLLLLAPAQRGLWMSVS